MPPGPILNTNMPGTAMLLVSFSMRTALVPDPGKLKVVPVPESNPIKAGNPCSPFTPAFLSDVVHCTPWSSYRNMAYESVPSVARTHWNVLTY